MGKRWCQSSVKVANTTETRKLKHCFISKLPTRTTLTSHSLSLSQISNTQISSFTTLSPHSPLLKYYSHKCSKILEKIISFSQKEKRKRNTKKEDKGFFFFLWLQFQLRRLVILLSRAPTFLPQKDRFTLRPGFPIPLSVDAPIILPIIILLLTGGGTPPFKTLSRMPSSDSIST